jgi:hypothetical protein
MLTRRHSRTQSLENCFHSFRRLKGASESFAIVPPSSRSYTAVVKTIKVKSVVRYLAEVATIRKGWKISRHHELWFRAEDLRHHRTRLQPSVCRQRDSGLSKSVDKLLEIENDLYEEFRRCATQLSTPDANAINDEWDSYFLMQHHGAPTRLLDWTDGALIALHFAVNHKRVPPESGSVIYVLDPYWLLDLLRKHPDRKDAEKRWQEYAKKHPSDYDEDDWQRLYLPPEKDEIRIKLLKTPVIPILWDGPHVTRRIAAQRSRFMIFGTDPMWLVNLGKERGSRLRSITIPKNAISRIRRELRDAGITESVVFPDLDGLGRELKQVWEMRR